MRNERYYASRSNGILSAALLAIPPASFVSAFMATTALLLLAPMAALIFDGEPILAPESLRTVIGLFFAVAPVSVLAAIIIAIALAILGLPVMLLIGRRLRTKASIAIVVLSSILATIPVYLALLTPKGAWYQALEPISFTIASFYAVISGLAFRPYILARISRRVDEAEAA